MLTPEQLKGKIRNIAHEKNLSSQEILQMYLFERVLERLSKTKYKNNLILKGGFLIASMIGIEARTTTIAKLWEDYTVEYTYASGIPYDAIMESVEELAELLKGEA